ncbi:hypothetical protein ES704_02634 [subsurface metagenome]|jgi:hypothetical protein
MEDSIIITAENVAEALEEYTRDVYNRVPENLRKHLQAKPEFCLYFPTSHQTPLLGWAIFRLKDDIIIGMSTIHQYINKATNENGFGFEHNCDILAKKIIKDIEKIIKLANRGRLLK